MTCIDDLVEPIDTGGGFVTEVDIAGAEDDEDFDDAKTDGEDIAAAERQNLDSNEIQMIDMAKTSTDAVKANSATIKNATAVASDDNDFDDDDLLLRRQPARAKSVKRVSEKVKNARRAKKDVAKAPPKGRFYTRIKFWAIAIPAAWTGLNSIIAILTYCLNQNIQNANLEIAKQNQLNNQNNPPKDNPTDMSVVPADLQALLKKKADEWKKKDVADVCDKILGLVKGYDLSVQAQLLVLQDLQSLTMETGSDVLGNADTVADIADQLEQAYQNSKDANKFLAIYETLKTVSVGTPARKLTTYEAAKLAYLALSDIYVLLSGNTKAPTRPTVAHLLYATPAARDGAGYHAAIAARFPLFEPLEPVAPAADKLPIKIIRLPQTDSLSATAVKDAQDRRGKALEYWRGVLPLLDGEAEISSDIGMLTEPYKDHPKGTMVVDRVTTMGGMLTLVPTVRLRIENRTLIVDTAGKPPGKTIAAVAHVQPMAAAVPAGVTLGGALQEGAQVASMIGMVVMATNPIAGAVVMIGGQVLGWLIGLFSGSKATMPTAQEMKKAFADALSDQYVKSLTDEASAVWSDIQDAFKKGWTPGDIPTAQELQNLSDRLSSSVSYKVPNNLHDNVVKLKVKTEETDKAGNPTGMQYIPSFMMAANIEIVCHQDLVLIYGAMTNYGNGPDDAQNKAYGKCLTAYNSRIDELVSTFDGMLTDAQQLTTQRMAQVSDMQDENEGDAGSGTIVQEDHVLYVTDTGLYPAASSARIEFGVYWIAPACCTVASNADDVRPQADAARTAYVTNLHQDCLDDFGIPDLPNQLYTLSQWKTALADSQASLKLLPKAAVPH